MSTRGTGQGGFFARTIEIFSVLGAAGFLHPGRLAALGKEVKRLGSSPAAGFVASARRRPDAIGLIDDKGSVTFGELHRRSNSLANALLDVGVKSGDGVGVFCRNHRGFVESMMALGKVGANTLLLNTGFAAPQLQEVLDREGVGVVLYDDEFAPIVETGAGGRTLFRTWPEGGGPGRTFDDVAESFSSEEPAAPASHGRATILTSGTTGTPKGAQRAAKSASLDTLVGLLGRMPLKAETTAFVVAPAFHSWGMAHLLLGSLLSNTVVFRRRFDPEDTLKTIDELRPRTVAVVPVMMQRILALSDETKAKYSTSSVEVVAASGSALPGELALRWMNTFGDNVYNFYGSTEVAQATIAMPDELRATPGTAGRPPRGTIVKIFDEEGCEMPHGVPGRIFVGNENQFDGYTGGGNKEIVQGLMSSGDVGRFDENGLLFVEGRDDDMIVSGGENVFPKEVEDLLSDHPEVYEAAVIGVPDEEFGQRLKAFVVLSEGARVDPSGLQAHVKQHLARYKVPREIVLLDELPRNPTGKVLKRVLREHG